MLQHATKTIEVVNYPYGRLRTSMYFSVEFKAGKGFRSVTQSLNPKTGALNKPHKGTYRPILLVDNTDGFCTFVGREFYKVGELNEVCQWISTNWELFTTEMRKELYLKLLSFIRLEEYSICTYCGAKPEQVRPLLKPVMEIAIRGSKDPDTDLFSTVNLDFEALEACKVEGYQPFTMTEYSI